MNSTTKRLFTSAAAIALGIGLQMQTGCYQGGQSQPAAADAQVEPYQPPPPAVVTVYQDSLNPYGSWVDVSGYGNCWVPNNQPAGWQPYTVGQWEYTDYGWTWIAQGDEANWGPICYHYGRWYRDPGHGWVWIPGTTWAPAWVAWREGGGYCGWAPLPPQCGFGPNVDVALVDTYVPTNQYVYCDERYVNAPRVDQHFVTNNVTIINQTTNITNITYQNNVVINQGVSITNVQRATGHPVEKVAVAQATTPEQARSLAASGKPVVFAPDAVRQAEQQRVQKAQAAPRNPQPPAPPVNQNPVPPERPINPEPHQPPPVTAQPPANNNAEEQRAAEEKSRQEQQAPEQKQQQPPPQQTQEQQRSQQDQQEQQRKTAQQQQDQKQKQPQDQPKPPPKPPEKPKAPPEQPKAQPDKQPDQQDQNQQK